MLEQPPSIPPDRPGAGATPGVASGPVIPAGGASGPVGAQGSAGTFVQPAPRTFGTYVLSGWWRRVGAALLDALILSAASVAVMGVFGAVFSVGFLAGEGAGLASLTAGVILAALAVTIASLFYAPLLMGRAGVHNGQTLGKQICGIRVVRVSGQPMDVGWAALREVAIKWLLFGLVGSSVSAGVAQILDVLWPLWDSESRALHDHIAQTRVVVA